MSQFFISILISNFLIFPKLAATDLLCNDDNFGACYYTQKNSLSLVDYTTNNMLRKSPQLLRNYVDDLCKLDKTSSCEFRNKDGSRIKSLSSFSDFLLLIIPNSFIQSFRTEIILKELSSDSRSTAAKVRLIGLINEVGFSQLVASVKPIGRPESLAILSRAPNTITHLNPQGYNQMQLILTKGFRYDQLELFYDGYQYRDYLLSMLSGVEAGFKEKTPAFNCYESLKLLETAVEMIGEVKQHSRFANDYWQSYTIWVKLWSQILDCVNINEIYKSRSRTVQVVDSVIRSNPKTDFNKMMGASLLLAVLQNAPSVNTLNGEDFAFDSISHLWKYANYQHSRYIQQIHYYSSNSLKSPITLFNMFAYPRSRVFGTKIKQMVCSNVKDSFCVGHFDSLERKHCLQLNNYKTDFIPVQSLGSEAKRQVASLVFNNQITGVSLTKKLRTLNSLISGLDSYSTVNLMLNSSEFKTSAEIVVNEIKSNASLFSTSQKKIFLGLILEKTSELDTELSPEMWELVPFSRFIQAATDIRNIKLSSLRNNFLQKPWKSVQASKLKKIFNLDLQTRLELSHSTKGAWIDAEDVNNFPNFFDVTQLIQSSQNPNQSPEYFLSVARKIQKYYSTIYQDVEFLLNFIEQPILASIPGTVMREFPVSGFKNAYHCQELLAKIGQLKDNYLNPRGRNQKLTFLFISNCIEEEIPSLQLDQTALQGLGSLICYVAPKLILNSIRKEVLETSLALFDQCCLSANQSAAIRMTLFPDGVTSEKFKYVIHDRIFSQIFGFELNFTQVPEIISKIQSEDSWLSGIYEFVNRGWYTKPGNGLLSQESLCYEEMMEFGLRKRQLDSHENATKFILAIENNLKCDTLKIIGHGIRWMTPSMINRFSSIELHNCLDYLGTELDSNLTSHIAEAIMNKLDHESIYQKVTISRIKNFLPNLKELALTSSSLLDYQNYDIIGELTNQKLSLTVLQWLQNVFIRPSFLPMNYTGLTQNEVVGKTLTAGSFFCHQPATANRNWIENLVTPKLISILSHAMRHCHFKSIEDLHVLHRLYKHPQNQYELNPGTVRELGVFAYPLLLAQEEFGFSHDLLIQSIALETFEIIPVMRLSEIPEMVFQSLSRDQALFLMVYRKYYLTNDQVEILMHVLSPMDEHFENEDVLEVGKLAQGDVTLDDVTAISRFRQNESEVTERFLHIVYIYSASETISATFLVTFITCFCMNFSIFC